LCWMTDVSEVQQPLSMVKGLPPWKPGVDRYVTPSKEGRPELIITIIIIRLLSQAFSSWLFSWTSNDPYRSGFKLHTAVLSVLCVLFQV
jgi:hypothetical protein